MKILLAGATFNSNFGDLLFSHLFYNKCQEAGFDEVSFWQLPRGHAMCDFCRNELNYHKKVSPWKAMRHNALIVYSGGMWGDLGYTWRGTVKRFMRFILPALVFTLLRKPVYILGAGGGPLHPSKDIKVYNLLYNHPVLYYVFQWFIRTAYFARFKVGDNSADFINRKLSN